MATTSDSTGEVSAAQRLMEQHSANDHHATVEEVPDEDAPAHPPPAPAANELTPAEPAVSAKAAGKQPARDAPAPKKSFIDTQSEELFPSLGAPKAAPASAPSMWSKKPAAVGKAANGVNGNVNGSNATSRTSTPTAGARTPATTASGPALHLPGLYREAVELDQSMLIPSNERKKPVPEILRDINKRSKATVKVVSGPANKLVLEGTGPIDAVRLALKESANQLCARQKVKVPVPQSIRGRIVGKQGATIQAISKRTGARINISKEEAIEILEDDLDATVDVLIEGDPFAVQLAKKDIEKIVNEHTQSVNTRLKHVPAEYYPFLTHPNNARLNELRNQQGFNLSIPQYHAWNQQAPAVPPMGEPASFAPQAGLPITLGGDRQAVAEAKDEIDRLVQELQRQLTLDQMPIERGRHQFIVGPRGSSLEDFVRETGCSVIIPPEHDETEMVTIIGPPEKLELAKDKVMDLTSSMFMANADVARAHQSAPQGGQAHAQDIARYLRQRKAFEELEKQHDASIVPESTGAWQIYARDNKAAQKARMDLVNLVNGHPPTRFHPLNVDPFYHQHLRQQAARQVRDQYGVRMVVPDESDTAPILLVFEDRVPSPEYQLPRRGPSPQEVQAFQNALREAEQHILGLISGSDNIVSKDVEAPIKFHDKIRRHVDRHHQSLGGDRIPVQVGYGGPRQQPQKRSMPTPNVSLRGPQNDVDALFQSLLAFIEQEKQDELERGFTLSFDFPQQYAQHLIGKRGENINRLREEFDVDIQLNDGKCEIKGPEAKANACKKHIQDLAKKFEDETTHHLHIPAQFHKDLIGPQGSQVNRLQDRYNVRVQFPRTKQSVDDDAPEEPRRTAQKPDEVVVKGPSKGADGCRDELLSLLQYVKDNSHTATVSVAQNQLPSLIGSGGREMEALRLETGAIIDVPNSREASEGGRAEIKIRGSKKAVEAAKKLIEEKAKIFDNTITRTLDVEQKHHRHIIGPQGSNLRSIIAQAGGPDDQRLHNRIIRFPKSEAEGSTIRVEGQKSMVDGICAAIQAIVAEQAAKVTDIAEVKPDKHRLLIGRGGETRRQLEEKFNVSINVPRQTETGPQRSQVRIAGTPENVEKAKAHILDITKDQEGESVPVPKKLHHVVSDNGQFFRRLRNDHKVTVDHDGQRPPPKPSTPQANRATGGAMPLITDDPSVAENSHSWETHDLHSSTEEGDIPWNLSGPSPEAIAAAKAKLAAALEEARNQDTVGFLILPDPRAYRHVIGPGGQEINRIRNSTGAKIQVPRDQSKGEAISVTGSKQGVEAAKQMILDIVQQNS